MTTINKVTFATVRAKLAEIGMTIRPNEFNEYRVAFKGDHGDGILIERGHTRESQIDALETCLSEAYALLNYTEKQAAPRASIEARVNAKIEAVANALRDRGAKQEKTVYRLGSNMAVSAPGVVAWAISGYWNKPDRATLEKAICDCWNVPLAAARLLLTKAAAYRIENETVIFEA